MGLLDFLDVLDVWDGAWVGTRYVCSGLSEFESLGDGAFMTPGEPWG